MPLIMYHGTSSALELSMLRRGTWITDDIAAAEQFAEDKCYDVGGSPVVFSIEIAPEDVDWDFSSGVLVDDTRGCLLFDVAIEAVSKIDAGQACATPR